MSTRAPGRAHATALALRQLRQLQRRGERFVGRGREPLLRGDLVEAAEEVDDAGAGEVDLVEGPLMCEEGAHLGVPREHQRRRLGLPRLWNDRHVAKHVHLQRAREGNVGYAAIRAVVWLLLGCARSV